MVSVGEVRKNSDCDDTKERNKTDEYVTVEPFSDARLVSLLLLLRTLIGITSIRCSRTIYQFGLQRGRNIPRIQGSHYQRTHPQPYGQ